MAWLTLGQFREFTKDLDDEVEIRVTTIIQGEKFYHTGIQDITHSIDGVGEFIVLEPDEIVIE